MMAGILPSQKLIAATPDVAAGTVWRQLRSLFGTLA